MNIFWDEDEWEKVFHSDPSGMSCGIGWKRRDPADVARIKAEKQKAREDAILAEADAIRARRGL